VVTARGAYLEEVARLAAEATARGEVEAARALLRAAELIAREAESDT
jgi:ABC-type arginine transport system permease subunit